jgi:hypothetical protein
MTMHRRQSGPSGSVEVLIGAEGGSFGDRGWGISVIAWFGSSREGIEDAFEEAAGE